MQRFLKVAYNAKNTPNGTRIMGVYKPGNHEVFGESNEWLAMNATKNHWIPESLFEPVEAPPPDDDDNPPTEKKVIKLVVYYNDGSTENFLPESI